MNRFICVGRLTDNPELKSVGDKSVAKFDVAINEGKDKTTYAKCEAWGNTAEFVSKWFKKGEVLAVEGRLRNDKWTDKTTGENRSRDKFVIDNVSFVPGANKQESTVDEGDVPPPDSGSKKTGKGKKPTAPPANFTAEPDEEDDIPF